jgi:hypothetical protein
VNTAKKSSLGADIFLALVIVGFIAGGVGALSSYLEQRKQTEELVENGVEAEAQVVSVTETTQFRGGRSTTLTVSFDPSTSDLALADVTVCTEADYDEGAATVQIVHSEDDPEVARLAECVTSVDSQLGLVFGVIFLGLGVFLLWRLIRGWIADRETPDAQSGSNGTENP